MSLIYSDEQQQLHDSARDFLAARSPVAVQRRVRDEQIAAGFDPQVWQGMIELGWSAVAFAEDYQGLEFGFGGFAPLFEQLGRHLGASPLLSSVVLCGALMEELASEAQKQELIPKLISGELRLALALEENVRHAPDDIRTTAQLAGDELVLNGHKALVDDALEADAWLVVARLEDGSIGLFQVPANSEGARCSARSLIDSRNHAALVLEDVRLAASAQLGSADITQALELALDRGRACLAAELLGMAETVFGMTVEYLKTRVQFGAPIGTFQALQHRAARLFTDLQLARSTVMGAFEALEQPGLAVPERRRLVSLAKWKCNLAAQRVSNEGIQMHGGIGVTDEYDVGLFLKRIRVAQAALGNSDFHCQRYADNLNK
ncbi:acyl-CoA dehydrogenase family protein [Pseudomonas saliphila]|uniref:acyl-CoA dehydrogenase family protein n=1 Tax=Pseudomonas saliphila TaxID=2586906 RepID=UPI00123C6549|nr:acyl-CoA dehydrogenase family protein [Pseudomonas saliphila]